MANRVVTRTYTASIRNQPQVSDDLDSLGFSASKLWNVGRWTCDRVWSEIGHIPGHNELTAYLKTPFDRFTSMLEYKAEMDGISVAEVSERDTSKSCSCCGRKRKANRVERGLYVCDECETVANADVNGAENIRQKVSPSLASDGGDRSNGWLAQPSVYRFDSESGCFAPREQATS